MRIKTVEFGGWPTTTITEGAGDTTALDPCQPAAGGISSGVQFAILFAERRHLDANLLKALDDPAMAQTTSPFRITSSLGDRSRLALGEASPTEEVDANGNVTLNFFANYRALASGVQPGVAKADAIFMINYN
ncbi:MAG: fimbrial protein [Escherichia coli]